MSNILTNSIVRGFGNTIGRRAANSMLDNRQTQTSNGPVKFSTFTIITGTLFLGGFLGTIIGVVFYLIYSSPISVYAGLLLGMYLMYRYYISGNKKHEIYTQEISDLKVKVREQINMIEAKYINQEITKREYEILIKQAEKLLEKY